MIRQFSRCRRWWRGVRGIQGASMKHPLLRSWRSYHKPPRIDLDADPFNPLALIGYTLLILALVAGWAILTGGM